MMKAHSIHFVLSIFPRNTRNIAEVEIFATEGYAGVVLMPLCIFVLSCSNTLCYVLAMLAFYPVEKS